MKRDCQAVRNDILLKLSGGMSQKEIGKVLGITQQTVSYFLKKEKKKQEQIEKGETIIEKKLGAKPRLSDTQLSSLPTFLSKGSVSYGFEGDYWTQPRVRVVIQEEFGVTYEVKQVGRLLKKIGWTHQKPKKKIIDKMNKK